MIEFNPYFELVVIVFFISFIWLCQVLFAVRRVFNTHCSMRDHSIAACDFLVVTCGF